MSKLEKRGGEIVLSSNGMRAVTLDERGDLHVLLPEGAQLLVLPSDSGLRLTEKAALPGGRGVQLEAARASPKPELRHLQPPTRFTCPRCGSHWFGSAKNADGTLDRLCHGCLEFRFNQRDDGLYFKEVPE